MNHLITDVDGVLVDWVGGFERWMWDNFSIKKTHDPGEYTLAERFGVASDELENYVKSFNLSAAIGTLRPIRNATVYLGQIRELGFEITALTSFGGDTHSRRLRRSSLVDAFGDVFDNIVILPLGEHKGNTFTSIRTAVKSPKKVFVVEDCPTQSKAAWHTKGVSPIVMDHKYNRKVDFPHTRCQCWNEVYEHLKTNA